MSECLAPFAATSGPRDAKIMLLGEAWGADEEAVGRPFMGSSGQELTRMLADAGIVRRECFITNVFAKRPPDNKLDSWQIKTAEVKKLEGYWLPPMSKGNYLHPEHLPELERLRYEIEAVAPNIIVALGNTATWATLCITGINALRGTCASGHPSGVAPNRKVLPTYHPSAILRQWDLRVIAVADLGKALRESESAEIRRPSRSIIVEPTIEEIEAFAQREHPLLGVDIETAKGQITCIGFAPSPHEALVVPFVDWNAPGNSYWPTAAAECRAWLAVRRLLAQPCPKVFQNGLYDLQYIWKVGIPVANVIEDTMLLHHAMFPELQKGLGFLGSIYADEVAWKTLRKFKADTEKREE